MVVGPNVMVTTADRAALWMAAIEDVSVAPGAAVGGTVAASERRVGRRVGISAVLTMMQVGVRFGEATSRRTRRPAVPA